jgi:hypothetical protein
MLLAACAKAESAKERQPENLSIRSTLCRHGLWPHHFRTLPWPRQVRPPLLKLLEDALATLTQRSTHSGRARGKASDLTRATLRRRC